MATGARTSRARTGAPEAYRSRLRVTQAAAVVLRVPARLKGAGPDDAELMRLYLLAGWQGRGEGGRQVEAALARALQQPRAGSHPEVESALVADATLRRISARLTVLRHAPEAADPKAEIWRNWITACCFEHEGCSMGISATVRSRPANSSAIQVSGCSPRPTSSKLPTILRTIW